MKDCLEPMIPNEYYPRDISFRRGNLKVKHILSSNMIEFWDWERDYCIVVIAEGTNKDALSHFFDLMKAFKVRPSELKDN